MSSDVAPINRQHRSMLRALDARCGTPEGWLVHRQLHELPCWACEQARENANSACGSNAGWILHRRRHETSCDACDDAREEYERSKCGTYAGHQIHRRNKTKPCGPCAEANAARLAEWQAANPEKVRGYQATYYERHREQRIAYSASYRRRTKTATGEAA